MNMTFAYYDPDADIAWFPTGESHDVVSERVPGGLRDTDLRRAEQLVNERQQEIRNAWNDHFAG